MPKTEINFPMRPSVSVATLVVLLAILTGCGGMSQMGSTSGTSPDKPSGSSIKVAVTPANPALRVGTKVQFAAAITNSNNKNVAWSVNGIAGGNGTVGKIDANGLYLAPAEVPSPNPVSVEADRKSVV